MAYSNSGSRFPQVPPAVLNLIIINVLVFLAQLVTGGDSYDSSVTELFALHHYTSVHFQPYQLVTYMFMHASWSHIFFNMFSLFMFGAFMERDWGAKRFLVFYFICGVGSGIVQMLSYAYEFSHAEHLMLTPEVLAQYKDLIYTVGASGAIMGVLVAFGYSYPNLDLYLYFIPIPIKAKWAVSGMVAIDIFGGVVKPQGDNVAHFAHLGGALIGFIVMLFWSRKNKNTFY